MKAGIGAAAGFIACIFLANWAIERFGVVPVGFGLVAPAGVYFAGATFTLRDLVQRSLGSLWVPPLVIVGAALSALVSPQFALASGAAFLLSEMLDFAVYTPLRDRGLGRAVLASNTVGAVVDSVVFLWLAFGSLAFLSGQVVGKLWLTLPALILIWMVREILPRYTSPALDSR